MPANPTLSLVVPVYNGTNYLAEALASALSQSRPPDEIIVIDDGSDDDPAAIVAQFAPARCIRQPQSGLPSARNRGVAETKGDLITFLDHDDLLTHHSLEARSEALGEDASLAYVYGVVEQFISPELDQAERDRLPARLPTVSGRVAGSAMIRRKAFQIVGTFAPSLRSGYMIDWVSRCDAAGLGHRAIGDVVLHRRVHSNNSAHDVQALETHYLRALRDAVRRKKQIGDRR
ncbi:MAG TPA: glycosyltransferase family A protein [Allosphingosinicella sp.]|nr:glycosyltransferase family A protein [Allosphingosinicella sp.]